MAELVIDTLASVLRKHLGVSDIATNILSDFNGAIRDSGLKQNIDSWRDCFYGARLPKMMSHSTANIQMQNLEREVIKIRTEGYCKGFDRKARTLNAFDVTQNAKGHTVLKPTTHLADIILQNTFNENLQLPKVPSGAFERAQTENTKLKMHVLQLEKQIATLNQQIQNNEDAKIELAAVNSVLNFQRNLSKKLQAQRDEAQMAVAGLCKRFGLQCSIDNHGVDIIDYDRKGKRKGRKNRLCLVDCYTFGDFDKPIEDQYIKDLTTEGVEPNPGPPFDLLTYITFVLCFITLSRLGFHSELIYPEEFSPILHMLQIAFLIYAFSIVIAFAFTFAKC